TKEEDDNEVINQELRSLLCNIYDFKIRYQIDGDLRPYESDYVPLELVEEIFYRHGILNDAVYSTFNKILSGKEIARTPFKKWFTRYIDSTNAHGSRRLQSLFNLLDYDAVVLTGETGIGKTTLAQYITQTINGSSRNNAGIPEPKSVDFAFHIDLKSLTTD